MRHNDLQNAAQTTEDWETRITLETDGYCRCYRGVLAVPVPLVAPHERGKDRITITTKGTYPWPCVTLTFRQINMSIDTLCPVVNLIVRKIRKTRDSNIHCLMYSLRKYFVDKVSSRVVCGDSWCMKQYKHIRNIFFVFRQFQLFYSWLSNFLLKSSLKKLNI